MYHRYHRRANEDVALKRLHPSWKKDGEDLVDWELERSLMRARGDFGSSVESKPDQSTEQAAVQERRDNAPPLVLTARQSREASRKKRTAELLGAALDAYRSEKR